MLRSFICYFLFKTEIFSKTWTHSLSLWVISKKCKKTLVKEVFQLGCAPWFVWDGRKYPTIPLHQLVGISLKIRTQNWNTNSVLVETGEKHATELLLVIKGEGQDWWYRGGQQMEARSPSLWSRGEAMWGGGWRQEPLKPAPSFRLHPVACEILDSWQDPNPYPLQLEAQSLNHWTSGKSLFFPFLFSTCSLLFLFFCTRHAGS